MEGFPTRPVEPVGVEPDLPAVGPHHQRVQLGRQPLDVGGASPADVGVTAAMEQVQDRPLLFGAFFEARGQQQADRYATADGWGIDHQVPGPVAQMLTLTI